MDKKEEKNDMGVVTIVEKGLNRVVDGVVDVVVDKHVKKPVALAANLARVLNPF